MYDLEQNLLAAALGVYAFALVVALVYLWTRGTRTARAAVVLCGLGAALQLAGLAARSAAAGRWPFASLYEFLLLAALGIAAFAVLAATRYRMPDLIPFALLVVVGLAGYASVIARPAEPLVPALQSYWLQFHVATAILAYGAFTVAAAAAVLRLARSGRAEEEAAQRLDRLTYRLIAFGFALLTLVIITGAVWAEEAWGAWWSWDPKETWALITWLIYAFYLHACRVRGWHGRGAAWLAVGGFVAVLFTLLGVTCLLPGLHSY
ncbi:MAG: c-type cytochrome biogenesis protein CcsB [Bacillota bacterium]